MANVVQLLLMLGAAAAALWLLHRFDRRVF